MADALASLVEACLSRQITLTTLARDDDTSCDRLQTSLVRGNHELLYWGAGPELKRGDIVALYTPKSVYLPDSEHSCIRRFYFAAADSTPGDHWRQHVFLHRRVNLDCPLTWQALGEEVGLGLRRISNAGTITTPLTPATSKKFYTALLKRCGSSLSRIEALLEDAASAPKICISYSGRDWTQAHRLKLWLDGEGITTFFVSPVGKVLANEREPLADLLEKTFSAASIVVSLVPAAISDWIDLELNAAAANARRIVIVRTDKARAWPAVFTGANVRRIDLDFARERQFVSLIKKELAALRGQ